MTEEIKLNHLFKDFEEYKDYLDKGPEDGWIQLRSLGQGKPQHKFIPLFILQANADLMFREWHVTNETPLEIRDGIGFTVKIQALPDYPGADLIFFTGTAAVPFKDVKNAIEFDVPNSRQRAIGNALSTLGNVFGRSLNRTYKVNREGKEEKAFVSSDFTFRKKDDVEA